VNSDVRPEGLQLPHQRVNRLQRLAGELTSAIPQQSEGSDLTGRVSVFIGPAGLPVEIRVHEGWERRLGPEELGAAVMDAYDDAVRRAMQAWTDHLDAARWWRRQRDAEEELDVSSAPLPPLPMDGRVREDVQFSEPVLQALHAAGRRAGEPTASAEAADEGGNIIVRLGAGGLTGCEISPGWARNRDGATVSAALVRALMNASRQVADARREPHSGLDTGLSDALATLSALSDHSPNRGDQG
jgi:hypothetical protein